MEVREYWRKNCESHGTAGEGRKGDNCGRRRVGRSGVMRCLGIAIKKNEIWYSVLDGSEKNTAFIFETGKENYRADSLTLMMDFYNMFLELITKYKPERVVYKLSLEITMQQVPYLHYSLGILNLVCLQHGIFIRERSIRWITASKKAKILEFERYFANENYKNEKMEASLIAWYELEE